MTGLDSRVSTAENYRRFARLEAAGRSAAYEVLAFAVAEDDLILSFLERLDAPKRQPNLLFAAARYLLGSPPDADTLHQLVAGRSDDLLGLMTTRRTQTNEAARCAALLPALCQLPPPLALLEVGASAGLTLVPDLYSYDYDGYHVLGRDPAGPTIRCRVRGPVPLPDRVPEVTWRAGIDLNPLDVTDPDDLEWLACLIWPGEEERATRLGQAAAVVSRVRPSIRRGDLLDCLAEVAADAPKGSTLVVYHTAVLSYVEESRRDAFANAVGRLNAVWLSNEAPRIIATATTTPRGGGCLLVRDGRRVLARTDPHGTWLEWLEATEDSPRPHI